MQIQIKPVRPVSQKPMDNPAKERCQVQASENERSSVLVTKENSPEISNKELSGFLWLNRGYVTRKNRDLLKG